MDFAPGQVFRLYCATCKDQKTKYFVVALVNPILRCFLINTSLTDLQKDTPELADECVPLLQAQHPFLSYDSYLGCNQLFSEYTARSIEIIHSGNAGIHVGDLHPDAMEEAFRRFPTNVSLPIKRVTELLVEWKVPA